jgi:hypothetical protein
MYSAKSLHKQRRATGAEITEAVVDISDGLASTAIN